VLEGQLQEILELIKVERNKLNGLPVYIAYEPAWSIGTGVIPEIEYLGSIFAWIYAQIHKCAPYVHWNLLYGGSVTPENVQYFKKIDNLSGFLIGKSSTNFQEFEKIIKRIYYP
jgi:triosephosphate isomerase